MEILLGALAQAIMAVIIADLAQRPQLATLREKLRGDTPEKLALQHALAAAYATFAQQYPDLTASFFDEHYLNQPQVATELAKLLTPDQDPDQAVLAELWGAQFSHTPDVDLDQPITVFVGRLEQEIKAQPVLKPFVDSRAFDQLYLIAQRTEDQVDIQTQMRDELVEIRKVIKQGQQAATHDTSPASVTIGDVEGGIHNAIIAGGNVTVQFVNQMARQTGGPKPPERNLPAQLAALRRALDHLIHPGEKAATQAAIKELEQAIADLPAHEQSYRQRLKDRFGEDAPYYIPLAGETTEVAASTKTELQAPRSARRRRQRALAEYHEWVQEGKEIKRVKLTTLREGVDKYPCLILLGDPGSGKTTALEQLANEFADEMNQLPLPLQLSEFGSGMTVEGLIVQGWEGSLDAHHWQAPELVANLEGYLEDGQLFILFDALNEMPREGYKQRIQSLRTFIDKWSAKGNHFLVTCRVLDYGEELFGLQRVEVQPLNGRQVADFLRNELGDDWRILGRMLVEGDEQHRLFEIAQNPYLLTIMIDVFVEDGRLGQNRAELMGRFTEILMSWAETKSAPGEWLKAEVQREALSVMAYEMQDREGSGAVAETELVVAVMPPQVQTRPNWTPVPSPPDRVLTLAASANIIEMPADRSSVRFYHQLLQEYFAARHLLKQDPTDWAKRWRWKWLEVETPLWVRPEDNWDPLPPPEPTGWEETTILAAGLAAENDDQLVRALIDINPVLAGRCLHEGQARVAPATRQAVIEVLLLTISRPEVALRVRIVAGEVLGDLGDPRPGELVTIPAGKFLMGGKAEDEGKLQHEVSLPEYQIGKYPLTNAEYGRFIEAGGYQEKRWWTEVGWQDKGDQNEPRNWRDSRYNKPNQPVVGVSWYECVAYCRWLSAETGQQYHLPTEAEWEKAARGVDGRVYPWGKEFETSRLNSDLGDQTVRNPTPVGIYPTGISPFGAFDCAGNVWEWVQSEYQDYPYQTDDGQEDLDGTNVRVLRGGSGWFGLEYGFRCARRLRNDPGRSSYNYGCRVAASPSI